MLFNARMKPEKKQSQSVLLLLGSLTGIVRGTCENLAEDPSKLEEEDAFDALNDFLDSRLRHERWTELPEALE